MPDPTGNAADRFDEWLDADGRFRPGDDLTGFADRVMRDGALPETASTVPSRDQRNRMRARVFGGVPATSKARTPMTTHAFSANGATPAPLPITERDRPATSGFSILMTAALLAVIGIAAFGLVRNSFDFTLPGGGDNPTGVPGVALSPEATPATDESCDLSNGVPVFDVRVPAFDGLTPYAVLDDGTLTLRCGDTQRELATDVRSANTIAGSAAIFMVTNNGRVKLLDVNTGSTLKLEYDQMLNGSDEIAFQDVMAPTTMVPWLITPANNERTDWRITDLRSLDTFLLSDELGKPLPRPFTPYFGQITGTDVAVVTWHEPLPNLPSTPSPGGVNGVPPLDHAALVLPGSIEDRRWIEVVDWSAPDDERVPESQAYSISQDGELLAYTTLSDTFSPVIRIEDAVDGTHVVDVPIDEIDADTTFILAGREPHLAYTHEDSVRIVAFVDGAARQIADFPFPHVTSMLPTADPDTILISDSDTATLPVNVTTGDAPEFYQYVPPISFQVFGGDELPANIVRVGYASSDESDSIISLVNPATGEVVLQSDPIDQHPVEIISYPTWLRDGGQLALVQVAPDRAIVMNANTQEIWEVHAPDGDLPEWDFYLSPDGTYLITEARMNNPETMETDAYISPLEPNPDWKLIEVTPDAPSATPAA